MTPNLVSDSGVVPGSESYHQSFVYDQWNEFDPGRLAQIVVTVHRWIERSSANAHVWQPGKGWTPVAELSPERWWYDVPGYTRWEQDRAGTKTKQVADRLMEEVAKLAASGSLV